MQIIRAFVISVDDFIGQQAFGGATWGQVLLVAFAIAMLLLVWGFLSTSSRKPEPDTRTVVAYCLSCGWRGRTSRHRLECPHCGDELEIE